MVHRGPDGYRLWISPDKQSGLVHRRLSIVDLTPAGFQPMTDSEQTIIVCCNGEIYNHLSIRAQLEQYYQFKSRSDTETILYAYKHWGISMLDHLEGDFAIVIIDLKKNETYLIRDRIGVKPLYFSTQSGMLSFASEIKALWPLPWITRNLNEQALHHYLTFLVTPAPLTLYKNIYKLPAGFYLKLDAKKNISFVEWYNPLNAAQEWHNSMPQEKTEFFYEQQILLLLQQAVKKRLMTDVPLGAFLSGGIDSSLIVACMAAMTDNVKTFNISFADGPEYSEVQWARMIANKFGTDHHEIVITEKDAFNFFESMVYHQDEPLADCVCIPLYYVSKLLKDNGVTVVLVGEGSDELFCGYESYVRYLNTYYRYWNPSQKYIPEFMRKGLYYAATQLFPAKMNRLDMIKNWADGKHLFWSGATAFSELWKKNIVYNQQTDSHDPILEQIYPTFGQHADSYALVQYHLKKVKKEFPQSDFLTSMIYLELKQRLPELLLMRVDKMGMATSIEGRVPFLDHKLVECALMMPTSLKYNKGVTKYILKKIAEKMLPEEVVYRKKVGFAAPTMRWFKHGTYFKPYFNDLMQTKRKDWGAYINFDEVNRLFIKNQESSSEYSVQLWALQNVLACTII